MFSWQKSRAWNTQDVFSPPGSAAELLYLSIDFMQPILDRSFHIFLPVGESERDAVPSRDDGHHLSICTLPNKRIQRNHLENKPNQWLVQYMWLLQWKTIVIYVVAHLQWKVLSGVFDHKYIRSTTVVTQCLYGLFCVMDTQRDARRDTYQRHTLFNWSIANGGGDAQRSIAKVKKKTASR